MPQPVATPGPFIMRSADDLTQQLLDYWVAMAPAVSDLSPGSVKRTELEAFAQVGQTLSADMATNLQSAIPQSAYQIFSFTPLPATFATGYMVLHVPAPGLSALPDGSGNGAELGVGTIVIAQGSNQQYALTAPCLIPALTPGYFHVPAQCLTLGSQGALASGAPCTLQNPLPTVTVYAENGAINGGDVVFPGGTTPLPAGIAPGRDLETPVEMQQRFSSFVTSLHRATLPALEYGAKTAVLTDASGNITEQVTLAKAIDFGVDPTIVTTNGQAAVYIYNGVGSLAGQQTSTALITVAQNIINGVSTSGQVIEGYKAAGIPTTVYGALEAQTSLTIAVTPQGTGTGTVYVPNSILSVLVQQAVQQLFQGYNIGDPFILSAVQQAVVAIPGVKDATVSSLSIALWNYGLGIVSGGTTTVGNYTTPTNAVLTLATGQPTITGLS